MSQHARATKLPRPCPESMLLSRPAVSGLYHVQDATTESSIPAGTPGIPALVPVATRSTRIASHLNVAAVRAIADRVLAQTGGGYAPESIRRELEAIDRSCEFSTEALRIFQDLLGRVGVA